MPTTSTTRILRGALFDNSGMVKNAKHPSFGGGAKGDGTTDDTAALQACLTASLTKGDVCVIPPGDYKVTAPLIPPASNAFMNSSKHRIIMHGARLFSYDATASRSIFKLNAYYGQDGSLILDGGTLDGSNAVATCNGVNIHCMNVTLRDVIIRYCDKGVFFVNDLAAPPICGKIDNCQIHYNTIGIHAPVSVSGLAITNNRIERNDEEGIFLDMCGKVSVDDNTIENNGNVSVTKPNLHIKGGVIFKVTGNHFESNAYQGHSSVLIEGAAVPTFGGTFTGNIVTGYYETSSGSGVALTASIGLDISGGGAGAVETVVAHGNYYAGQYMGVRINTNARGFLIGPDDFTDNYAPSFVTPACIRYSIVSANPGIVYDVNRYAGLVTSVGLTAGPGSFSTLATSGLHTAALGVKFTGGTTVVGSWVKNGTFGLLAQGVAGSTADFAGVNPGGGSMIFQVPTGTLVWEFGGSVKLKTATITYSASMTPNADAGNVQTITATNGTAFTINAPTNPRTGTRLRIRIRNTSGGALGVATWNAVFKMVAWTQPANGFSRSIDFDYDGTNWVEAFRSAADVAN
jgi:parallel beta-helix repeat protein